MKNFRIDFLSAAVLLLLFPGFANAAFEDRALGAVPVGMGESITAAPLGLASVGFNPAGLGELRRFEAQTGYQRGFQTPFGKEDFNRMSAAAGVPVGRYASLAVSGIYDSIQTSLLDRAAAVSFGTQRWLDLDTGYLDWGATVNALSRTVRQDGHHALKPALDVGILYRMGENQTFGFSILNANRPQMKVDALSDRAPAAARIGFAQTIHAFAMSVDLMKHEPSLGDPAGQSLAAGVQYWWNSFKYGGLAARTGLNLSDKSKSLSVGFGWKILGAEADYALALPFATTVGAMNSVSLLFRFGQYDPEKEFEKILDSEIRQRQELAKILERSEQRQKELTAEQEQLKSEIDALRSDLAHKTASEASARERLKAFEERERRAREAMDRVEAERRAAAMRSKESLFREDWAAYEKLKSQGAPDVTLIERLKQLLRQYKEAGVDLSEANKELLRLLRNRPAQ